MSVDFSDLVSATKAEAAAAGLISSSTDTYAREPAASVENGAPVSPSPTLPSAPEPVIAFAEGGPPRRATVRLHWPVVVDGVPLAEVVVRRLRVSEVRAYVAAVQAGQEVSPPMYETIDGKPLPKGLLDSLDQDDFDALDARAVDFLPHALKGDLISA